MSGQLLATARQAGVLKLLDDERHLLLHGAGVELGALLQRREAAVADVLAHDGRVPSAFVTALRTRAERNRQLLAASLDGARAASAQVSRKQAGSALRTYTAKGEPKDVARQPATRDKRA
jgi:hypothetical protein